MNTAWTWMYVDAAGTALRPPGGESSFPTQAEAEAWLGETWADLAEEGVASVTLLQDGTPVYGPMPLSE